MRIEFFFYVFVEQGLSFLFPFKVHRLRHVSSSAFLVIGSCFSSLLCGMCICVSPLSCLSFCFYFPSVPPCFSSTSLLASLLIKQSLMICRAQELPFTVSNGFYLVGCIDGVYTAEGFLGWN